MVVLASVGVKTGLLDLIAADGEQRLGQQQLRVSENSLAEQAYKLIGVRRVAQLLGDDFGAAAIHLSRIEQRTCRLHLKGVGAAVPEQAALRHHVRGALRSLRRGFLHARRGLPKRSLVRQIYVLGFPVIRPDAEVRLPVQVSQRGDGTRARQCQRGAAEHDRPVIRWAIGVVRTVTRRAGHLARRRQARIKKYLPAEFCHGGKRRDGTADQMNRIWVFAGQTLRFGREDGAGHKAGAEKPHDCVT